MKMKMIGGWILMASAIALSGCGSIKEQVSKDLNRPTAPTTETLAVDVYLDQSDSSTNLRADISAILRKALDTYPKFVRMNAYNYAKEVKEKGSYLSATQYIDEIGRNWQEAPQGEPRNTVLANVFDHQAKVCRRDTGVRRVMVIATDGGFEDPQEKVMASIENALQAGNLAMVVFVGVDPGNSTKLNTLNDLADFIRNNPGGQQVKAINVTLKGNDVPLADTKRELEKLIKENS